MAVLGPVLIGHAMLIFLKKIAIDEWSIFLFNNFNFDKSSLQNYD